jgi:hypothetical protein
MVQECRLGGSNWFVFGENFFLFFLQRVDDRLPLSGQRKPILPAHVVEVEIDLYRFSYEQAPVPGLLSRDARVVQLCSASVDIPG